MKPSQSCYVYICIMKQTMRNLRKISNEPKQAAKADQGVSKYFGFSETKSKRLRILKRVNDTNIPGRAEIEKGEHEALPGMTREIR